MGQKSTSFIAGGCGCLLAFAFLALVAVALGGRAHIDLGGAICLFVVGGIGGLIVLLIYNSGKTAARSETNGAPDDPKH
jgi:hypothetical protein